MNNYVKVATFSEQELPYTYMDACTLFTGNVYMSQKWHCTISNLGQALYIHICNSDIEDSYMQHNIYHYFKDTDVLSQMG